MPRRIVDGLVVTSGAKGDGKLLLWNALRGELASDLNSNLRSQDMVYPSIDTMEFCSENLLACGSDCDYGGSAVVQLWDIESPESYLSFSASDSYITSLEINPAGNTIITGSGDGTIASFDIRACSAIDHLSVGSGSEVTSVSFSKCGTYFSASRQHIQQHFSLGYKTGANKSQQGYFTKQRHAIYIA